MRCLTQFFEIESNGKHATKLGTWDLVRFDQMSLIYTGNVIPFGQFIQIQFLTLKSIKLFLFSFTVVIQSCYVATDHTGHSSLKRSIQYFHEERKEKKNTENGIGIGLSTIIIIIILSDH